MQFKAGVAEEFGDRAKVSDWLRFVLTSIGGYAEFILGVPLVVTDILRKPETQLRWCKAGNYRSGFRHCIGVAADIRSRNLTEDQRKKLLRFVKRVLKSYCTLKFHPKGSAPHFHLELNPEYYNRAEVWALVKNIEAEEWFTG